MFNNKKIKELEARIDVHLQNWEIQIKGNELFDKKISSLASHLNLEWRSKAVKKVHLGGSDNNGWGGTYEEAVLEWGYVEREQNEDPFGGNFKESAYDKGYDAGWECGYEAGKEVTLTPKKSVKRRTK
jgi:hypothetical protein